jgi:hypothetical protein
MNSFIALFRAGTFAKLPRRSLFFVKFDSQLSTRFTHEAPVGV